MHRLFLVALVGLAACASQPLPPPAPQLICPPVKTYTPDQQKQLADAISALPPTSPLIGMALDYSALRDATRACQDTLRPIPMPLPPGYQQKWPQPGVIPVPMNGLGEAIPVNSK